MRLKSMVLPVASRSGKVWLNSQLDRVIHKCNRVMGEAEQIRWSGLRTVIQETARFVGDLALLLQQFPRMDAYQLSGSKGRIIFVGDGHGVTEVCDLFFSSGEVQRVELGRVALWTLPSATERWLGEGAGLVVCEVSRLYPWHFRVAYEIRTPTLIRQLLSLPKSLETLLAGSKIRDIRRMLNRAQKAGFSYRFSREKADFDLFYYKMYVPYITHRHGSFAYVMSYEAQWQEFTKGGLILITQDQKPVAGSLVVLAQERCLGIDGGVLDADAALLQLGIYTFNIWSVVQWGHSQGATLLDMGGSRAMRSDGVFRYKRNWGARVTRLYKFIRNNLIFLMQDVSPAWRDQINELGLITDKRGKFYGVVLAEGSAVVDEAKLAEARRDGLSGLAVISPNHTIFCNAPAEFDQKEVVEGQ